MAITDLKHFTFRAALIQPNLIFSLSIVDINALHGLKTIYMCFVFYDITLLGKMNFQRSCRTDKHVSAARLVISFKMYELDNAVEIINSFLPKSVRVHDYVRTTKGFDCKKWASSRIYNYVVPSYCFQHKSAVNKQALQLFRVDETLKKRINEVLNHYHGEKF